MPTLAGLRDYRFGWCASSGARLTKQTKIGDERMRLVNAAQWGAATVTLRLGPAWRVPDPAFTDL